jgi:predicted ferric reductase
MNTAGTSLKPYNANIVLMLPALACLGVACVLGLAATLMCSDPVSPARYSLLHTHCCGHCRVGSVYVRVGSTLRKRVGGLGWSGVGTPVAYIAATAAVALALATTWAVAAQFFSHYMPYAYARDLGEPVWRAAGYALAVALGLALLPPAKNSLWLRVFGASFERALRLHRWTGFMVAVLTCLHGIGIGVAYGRTYGAAHLFTWSSATSVNPLAGSLAGIAICVMTILAWEPIRRRWYGLFLAGHALWPLIVIFTFLHTRGSSEVGAVYPLLLGTALMALDYAWRAMDACARPVRVTDVALVAGEDGVTPDVVSLCLTKDGMRPPRPGSFVYLLAPSISLVPHPFSVSSPPAASASGYDSSCLSAFTLHIKASRPSSFTGALLKRVAAAASKRAAPSSSVVPLSDAGDAVTAANPALPGSASPSAVHGAGVLQRFLGLASAATGEAPTPSGTLAWPAPGERELAAPAPPRLPRMYVYGPFGRLSLHIDRYEHVLLVAGGIGITPIASLHYSLQNGLATGDAVVVPSADGSARAAPLRTLTTLWTVRSAALVQEFAPLLLPQAASSACRSDVGGAEARASPFGAGAMPAPVGASANPSALCKTTVRIHCTTATLPGASPASAVVSPPARAAAVAGADAEPGILMTQPAGHAAPAPGASEVQQATRPFLHRGRADIAQTVATVRQQVMQAAPAAARAGQHAVAVVVCGPAALVEEVVRHCHAASAGGACRFHVHRETFEF